MPGPDGALVSRLLSDFQRLDLGGARAAELALEVERLNTTVLEGAEQLGFFDEPSAFAALLDERAP